MSDPREVIAAASLRASPAWTLPPDAEILWQEDADSGTPHGYDDLDRAASTRAFVRAPLDWDAVLDFYREHFERSGWPANLSNQGQMLRAEPGPGVSVAVIARPVRPGFWAPAGAYDHAGTVFELSLRNDRPPK
jgi:hypothetical protein